MAKVTQIKSATAYDIEGLTTSQAAVIAALLGQMLSDPLMQEVYDELVDALSTDPNYRKREVMEGSWESPATRVRGYYTQEEGSV